MKKSSADDERGVLIAARVIRPFLPDLVGPLAGDLDLKIAGLLEAAGRGENVIETLRSVLASHPATADFIAEVLADAPLYRVPPELRPEGLVVRDAGLQQPAGGGSGVAAAEVAASPSAFPPGVHSWLYGVRRRTAGLTRRQRRDTFYALRSANTDPELARLLRESLALAEPTAAPGDAIPITDDDDGDGDDDGRDGGDAGPPDQRFFTGELDDHPTLPLTAGDQYTIAFSVGPPSPDALGESPFPEEAFAAADADLLELTVQLDSGDFEIYSESTRTLWVPRAGRSLGKARFDISPRRNGECALAASLHFKGNFVQQMTLMIPVGDGATTAVEVSRRGRPTESAAALEPRDISILLEPAPGGGFSCTALASVVGRAVLPIKDDELAAAVGAARAALMTVIESVSDGGLVYQDGIDIPGDAADSALRTLARAGSLLFSKLFLHPAAGPDARAVGEWLRSNAMDPRLRLTLQIVADCAPLPWAMLYLGDAAEGATLDWNNFLGMRHIIEQLPLQRDLDTRNSKIPSVPSLAVSVNVNTSIDTSMGTALAAEQRKFWPDTASDRDGLTLVSRSTKSEVVSALADNGTGDQVVYFYCHAKSGGRNKSDPDASEIIMGKGDSATLADLSIDAPISVKLPGNPLVFINACESAELSPLFYDGFVPYFMAKGARGVIGTECKIPARFAIAWADAFFEQFLDGVAVGEAVLKLRQDFLREHRNALGLVYAIHCDTDTRIAPALRRKEP